MSEAERASLLRLKKELVVSKSFRIGRFLEIERLKATFLT